METKTKIGYSGGNPRIFHRGLKLKWKSGIEPLRGRDLGGLMPIEEIMSHANFFQADPQNAQ